MLHILFVGAVAIATVIVLAVVAIVAAAIFLTSGDGNPFQ